MLSQLRVTLDRLPTPQVAGRPLVARPAIGAWLVMLLGMYIGYGSYERNFRPDWAARSWNPGANVGANFQTYRWAAELARQGDEFYGTYPPGLESWAEYLYPPITVVAYYPFTLTDWMSGYQILLAMNLLAGLVTAVLIVRLIERYGRTVGWLDVALILGLFAVSPFTFGTMYYGNINLILAAVFMVGFLALDRDYQAVAGSLFGLAALFKLFPALIGVWLLRRRAWRSIVAAVAVGLGGLVAGIIMFGWQTTHQFFFEIALGRTNTGSFVGGYPADGWYYVTIQRPISWIIWTLWPDAPAALLTPAAVVVAGGVLAVFYRDLDGELNQLFAILATLVITITLIPALQWYLVLLFFPMIPLLYLWSGPGRIAFTAGALLLFVNERPGNVIEWIGSFDLPRLLELALFNVAGFATIQLYAMGLMLGACAWHLHGEELRERAHDAKRSIHARRRAQQPAE